jgi:hypothetical protein
LQRRRQSSGTSPKTPEFLAISHCREALELLQLPLYCLAILQLLGADGRKAQSSGKAGESLKFPVVRGRGHIPLSPKAAKDAWLVCMSPASFHFPKIDQLLVMNTAENLDDSPYVPLRFSGGLRKSLNFNALRKHLQ